MIDTRRPWSPRQSEKSDVEDHSTVERHSPDDYQSIVHALGQAGGGIEKNGQGRIIAVDLAKERSSTTDAVLLQALNIPELKKLRVAGSTISNEALLKIAGQSELEELFLRDVTLSDEVLKRIVDPLHQLRQLTLRRCETVGNEGIAMVLACRDLERFSMIELGIGRAAVEAVVQSSCLYVLDLRHCSRLGVDDYRLLSGMPRLRELKIGGFSVDDEVLSALTELRNLRSLTLEDSMVTASGFLKFAVQNASGNLMNTCVLARNSSFTDEVLVSLKFFPHLSKLLLNDLMVSGEFLVALSEEEQIRPKLEILSLRNTFFDTTHAGALKKYRELKQLDLSGLVLTPELIRIVVGLPCLRELDISGCEHDEEVMKILLETNIKIKRT